MMCKDYKTLEGTLHDRGVWILLAKVSSLRLPVLKVCDCAGIQSVNLAVLSLRLKVSIPGCQAGKEKMR
eukprot:709059-Amphidinium_carterae.1